LYTWENLGDEKVNFEEKSILFLLIDCLRADKCVDRNHAAKTPTLDFLRTRGTLFSTLIASSTTTSPCVATILMGTYPFVHGIQSLSGYSLRKELKTLPQLLKEKGYHTYAEVTGPLVPELGLDKGFDEYNFRENKQNIYSFWGEQLIERLVKGHFKNPWFLFLHIWVLHSPRKILPIFKNRSFGNNVYERALSSLDSYLKRLFENINLDNTFIILTGDHGEEFYSTELGFKGFYTTSKKILHKLLKRLKIPVNILVNGT